MPAATPAGDRDRDPRGRPANARQRDNLGRPLDRQLGREAGRSGGRSGENVAEPSLSGGRPTPARTLRTAQTLLDTGQPFTAHEAFESMWKATSGERRELWRGLAQLAVGITHALRGNTSGARALLARADQTLDPFAGTTPHRVDVDALRQWTRSARDDLSRCEQPPRLLRSPEPSGGSSAKTRPLGE